MINFLGIDISTEDIVVLLRRSLTFTSACREVLSLSLVQTEAAMRSLEVSEAEIQIESDALRRRLQLESTEKTLAWLSEQQLSAAEWEESIRDRLLKEKLADAMFGEATRLYFTQNKLNYERVVLYQILVETAQVAQELSYQIEEREISFFEAAHIYNKHALQRDHCGYEGHKSRWMLNPDVAASVFGASPQAVVGPLSVAGGHALFFVDRFIASELTDEIYAEIRDRKFQQWLDAEIQRLQP